MTAPGMVGLLKRDSSLTHEEFNSYWLDHHAAIGIPWALANGCLTYIQIQNPRSSAWATIPGNKPEDLDISAYEGAAELTFKQPPLDFQESAKSKDFFKKVILVDERKFLPGPAREIARFVDARLIDGDRIVLIEDGKIQLGENGKPVVPMDEAFKLWDAWVVKEEPATA